MAKKKILYVATVDIHIKTFHLPYLKMMHNKGWEVQVATNGKEKFPYCDKKHTICMERSPYKLNNIKAIKQMKELFKKEHFDIIHCHTPMGSVVTRIAAKQARKKGTRVIYTAHGFHFYKGAPLINWLLFYPIEKYLAKYTDTLITINQEDYKRAKKKFNKRCRDIQYVPGVGIETEKFNIILSKSERKKLLNILSLDEHCYILTCVARLDKNKNQGFLINVMDRLDREYKNIHLLLVGPDESNGYYNKIVRSKGSGSNIHFLGMRKDIPCILALTDIVVSASKREGLPANIIESFAAGKPVVALSCRGMNDLISSDSLGYLIKDDNIDLFCDSIIKIYKNGFNSKKIRAKAKSLSINNIIRLMEKIYFINNTR